MKRVLITGASGFIGNNLARFLLAKGHEVHLLLRQGYNTWRINDIRRNVRIHLTDLLDEDMLNRVVRSIRPEWVFHLVVHGAYSSQTDVKQMLQTNIIGTVNLVHACLKTGFESFINTGSSSEYGFKDHSPAETEFLEPNSYYAATKASATLFCRYTARSQGLALYTLRLYSVFGPYEEPGRLMPTLITHGLKGTLPPLVNPDTVRDFVYIDDVSEAYFLAATRPNQEPGAVYNVGTSVQTSLRTVVEVARRMMDITVEPKWGSMPNRDWDTYVWLADNRKIKEQLGWQPKYTFEQGFRTMVDWFRNTSISKEIYVVRK